MAKKIFHALGASPLQIAKYRNQILLFYFFFSHEHKMLNLIKQIYIKKLSKAKGARIA